MLNRIVVIGRLVADVELKHTKNDIAVANFALAVDRKFRNANNIKEADFIDVVVWRGQAENCAKYLSKGKLCAVDGSLQIRTYEAKDGSSRKAVEIVAEDVRFLSPADNKGAKPQEPDDISDDDLPF